MALGSHGDDVSIDVEEFLLANGVDDRASSMLCEESAGVQRAVMDLGPVVTCDNPSSRLVKRIIDVKKKGLLGQGTSDPAAAVDNFLTRNIIDERASEMLRECTHEVQRTIIHMGDLADCSNPSSKLVKRIIDTKKASPAPFTPIYESKLFSGSKANVLFPIQVESYLANNGIDDRAAETFRSEDTSVQAAVIALGSVGHMQNPSSALVKRILATKKGGPASIPQSYESNLVSVSKASVRHPNQVELYLVNNGIDDRAAETFRGEDTSVQAAVIAMGPVGNMQNPSSALIKRMIDVKKNGLGSNRNGNGAATFLAKNGIGAGAPAVFRGLTPALQARVMQSSASLVGRGMGNAPAGLVELVRALGSHGSPNNVASSLRSFLSQGAFDMDSTNMLKQAPPGVQAYVLERAEMLLGASNPSSALVKCVIDGRRAAPTRAMPY